MVNVNLSQQMTLLGLAAMVFYAILLATGTVGTDVMPQFMVSAIIFLSSGRLMRKAARNLPRKEPVAKPLSEEPNWELRSQILNWFMALLIIGLLSLWVMKPVGVTFIEFLTQHDPASNSYQFGPMP